MTKRGYNCFYDGKWHIPRKLDSSFTVLYDGTGVGERIDPLVARTAEAFLHSYDDEKPFFLNAGFLNPHDICFWTFGRTPGKWEAAELVKESLPPLPPSYDPANPALKKKFHTEDNLRFYIYSYYRMVEMVDAEIGRIVRALESSKFKDNTILVFSSDHGEGLLSNNKTSKGYLYSSAARVPMVWYAPGRIPQGHRDEDSAVSAVDIPATILDYAEAPPMPGMTFARSLRPVMESRQALDREYTISETARPTEHTAVISKKMKVIFADNPEQHLSVFGSSRNVVAFDLERDPHETTDVASLPRYAKQINQHREYLADYLETIDRLPSPPGGWANRLKELDKAKAKAKAKSRAKR